AKAFGSDWIGSATASNIFLKAGIQPQSYQLAFEPHVQYTAKGATSLFDGEKGKTGHGSGNWLAFTDTPMELEIFLSQETSPKEVSVSLLRNESAYLCPPEEVEIWTGDQQGWKKLPNTGSQPSTKLEEVRFGLLPSSLPNTDFEKIKIRLKPISRLPSWHPGAGSKGWVFVDEILLH